MKRIGMLLLLLAIMICPARAEEIPHVEALSDPDLFYEEHLDSSIPSDQSEYFAVQYRVLDLSGLKGQSTAGSRGVRLQLGLYNLTDQPLKDVQFKLHFNERLQLLLGLPLWESGPVSLNAKNETDLSNGLGCVWDTFVRVSLLRDTGLLERNDFYDVVLELTWSGGGEILHITPETALSEETDEFAPNPIPDGAFLMDEERVRLLNVAGGLIWSGSDTYLADHQQDAIAVDQSETFALALRIVNLEPQASERLIADQCWPIRYEMELQNKTDQPLDDVRIFAHWSPTVQASIAAHQWSMTAASIPASNDEHRSSSLGCSLETYLFLEALDEASPLALTDFYDLMLEISWTGGGEILHITPDSQALLASSDLFPPIPDGCTLLDEDVIAQINEASR